MNDPKKSSNVIPALHNTNTKYMKMIFDHMTLDNSNILKYHIKFGSKDCILDQQNHSQSLIITHKPTWPNHWFLY